LKKITKVLIIDDNATTRQIIGKILSHRGYEVFTCETAVNILETVSKYTPDVILMDHYMPNITGKEAIKQLKANEDTKSISVVYFSTYESLDVLARDAGADAYVSKESPVEILTNCIASLVTKSKN